MEQPGSSPATGPHAPAGFGPHDAERGAGPPEEAGADTDPFSRVDPGPAEAARTDAPRTAAAPPASDSAAARRTDAAGESTAGQATGWRTESAAPHAAESTAEASGTRRTETAEDLTTDRLLPARQAPPARGWRRSVWKLTGRRLRPPETRSAREREDLRARARRPVGAGHHRLAVLSLKGGVGKTTTTAVLGATLADARGDRVIAVDANPDRGTLAERVRLETAGTVRDLLAGRDRIQRYADVRALTSQAPSRLEVLGSDRDPAVSEAFSAADYTDVARVLERFYSISLTDCGTGLLHSAMSAVLDLADQLVIVSSPAVDGARSASATVDWLDAHGYRGLARTAVVALTSVRNARSAPVDIDGLVQHFSRRCRAVVRIPYDPHLMDGGEISLDLLAPATADAYLTLAATTADRFAAD